MGDRNKEQTERQKMCGEEKRKRKKKKEKEKREEKRREKKERSEWEGRSSSI